MRFKVGGYIDHALFVLGYWLESNDTTV